MLISNFPFMSFSYGYLLCCLPQWVNKLIIIHYTADISTPDIRTFRILEYFLSVLRALYAVPDDVLLTGTHCSVVKGCI